MALNLTSLQMEQLANAQTIIAEILSGVQRSEGPEARGCSTCYGSCKDECTGCHTCMNTSKVG